MATDEERLVVSLEAKFNDFEKNFKKAEATATRSFQNIQKQVSSATARMEAATVQSTQRINQSLATTSSSVGAFGKAFGVGFAAVAFTAGAAKLIDANTKIRNSLQTTGLAGADLEKVYAQLFEVANKNGAPVESLAQLYARVSVVQKELGVSSQQLIGLTDNVGKSLRITGSSAEEASGTLLQLAQAFGGSKIQAQEYNSLIDGALPLLKAAAAGIKQAGGSVSTLTALVKSGQISNKAFFDGIEAGAPVLDKMLGGAMQTVGQASTNFTNSLIKLGGNFENSTGGAAKLAAAIQSIADALPNLKFDGVVGGIGLITGAVETAIAKVNALYGALTKLTGFSAGDLLGKGGDAGMGNPSLPVIGEQTSDQKLADLADQRLRVEKQIADIKSQGLDDLDAGKGALTQYQNDLQVIDSQVGNIKQAVRDTKDDALLKPIVPSLDHPHSAATADTALNPIDITDTKYAVAADPKKKGGSGSKADPYEKETDSIKAKTAALQAETAAQAGVNPLVDDYGFASTRAATAAELFTKAQKSGTDAGKELANPAAPIR